MIARARARESGSGALEPIANGIRTLTPPSPAAPSSVPPVSSAAEVAVPKRAKEGGKGTAQAYGAEQIKILEGLEAVRKRPGMYIGDTGLAGLHHLVYEAVDNSIDECMAGRATSVIVNIHADGSVSVTDDGSGIPVDPKQHENPQYNGKPAVELVMTVLHAGGKFGEEGSAYKVSGGLHGVGISVVNALSERLDVDVWRDESQFRIGFARGKTVAPLRKIGAAPAARDGRPYTGTRVTFKPDPEMFPEVEFNYTTIATRLREMAYLNPGVTIRITDERVGLDGNIKDETFRFTRGLIEYVEHLNHNKQVLHEVVFLKGEQADEDFACEIALQYNDSYNELLLSFANNIRTVDGGTHLSGFKTALTRTLNTYARNAGLLKDKDPVPSGEDLREGLAAVISVKLPDPQFEGQTKGKLRNTDVEGFVSGVVGERLAAWLEEHPADAKRICLKGALAAQAREAARKARDLTRRKSALESGSMPHKLRDCTTKDVDRSELFIVEGDSAGGSATQGRNVETQAILPLRGKLINVEKARLDKVLAFEEIRTLISALRCGISEDFDISKLRYGRIIIMTDADVDGSHIRTLLLTFFFRQMSELIKRGRVYIAQPPLYLVTRGKREQYVLNESRLADTLAELGLEGASLLVRDPSNIDPKTGQPAVQATIDGENLRRLVRLLRRLNELVEIVERRGIRFADLLASRDDDPTPGRGGSGGGALPVFRVVWHGGAAFAWSRDQVDEIVRKHRLRPPAKPAPVPSEAEPPVVAAVREAAATAAAPAAPADTDPRPVAIVRELHENRELAPIFEQLEAMGIDIDDYARQDEEDVTGQHKPTRYAWLTPARHGAPKRAEAESQDADSAEGESGVEAERGHVETAPGGMRLVAAANVPSILTTLLDVGRRGMEIKRFKGLGEMDPEQLWDTTMDPSRRTLLRVNWDDQAVADDLFETLMGEDVERRRSYIEEHALEVKSLDV